MFSRKRVMAGASAVALAAGTTLAGASLASAQGLSEIAGDLELAAQALNGPVTVTANEGGPTVTYVNENDVEQKCVGFTLPYSTVDEEDIDPGAIGDDLLGALPLLDVIEEAGGVSILNADEAGDPTAYDSDPVLPGGLANPGNGILGAALGVVALGGGVVVPAGEEVEWTATQPDEPSAAVVLCAPDTEVPPGLVDLNFGVDKQVVADQINGMIPGGSIDPVGAGSVSGGSVDAGASVMGSLGSTGDDEEVPPPPPAE